MQRPTLNLCLWRCMTEELTHPVFESMTESIRWVHLCAEKKLSPLRIVAWRSGQNWVFFDFPAGAQTVQVLVSPWLHGPSTDAPFCCQWSSLGLVGSIHQCTTMKFSALRIVARRQTCRTGHFLAPSSWPLQLSKSWSAPQLHHGSDAPP